MDRYSAKSVQVEGGEGGVGAGKEEEGPSRVDDAREVGGSLRVRLLMVVLVLELVVAWLRLPVVVAVVAVVVVMAAVGARGAREAWGQGCPCTDFW